MNLFKVILVIFFVGLSCKIAAQEIEWQNTIGGNGTDMLKDILQTSDNGFIIGGCSSSNTSGDKTENTNGGIDHWIVKLDSTGSVQWQNTIGGNGDDWVNSISQTFDGGYIVGGRSLSGISGDKSEDSLGGWDYWVVKLDDSGNIQWQNTIGGTGDDYLFDVIQTAEGGYMLAGYSDSDISGDKTENSIGSVDFWIIKLDSSGSILWQKTIGGNGADQLISVLQINNGSYLLGGFSSSGISGDKTEICYGGIDYWIMMVDSTGMIQWQNTIGGADYDYLQNIALTSDGGSILGGFSRSNISGEKTENSLGDWDYWVVKLDSSGLIQWQNTIGGNSYDQLHDIEQTDEGHYVLCGRSYSGISGDKTEQQTDLGEYWVVVINSSGDILWQNTIGGNTTDWAWTMTVTNDGGIVLGGDSNSDIFGDKTEAGQGGTDYWVVKLSNKYNIISGSKFADLNSNNIQDGAELSLVNKRVSEINTGRFAFTDYNGFYSLAVLDSGNFHLTPYLIPNYYTASPAIYNVNFSSINQIDSLNDFAFQPTGNFNDLCISITPTTNFRSGMNGSYILNYSNVGTTTISNTTVIFYPDTNVTYVSASVSPQNITPDSVVFSIGNLSPFQTGQITVTIHVDVGLPIGTVINSGVAFFPIAGDVYPACNVAYREVLTTGSYDPNDILVSRSFLYDYEIPNEPELEYIIRFQNTGNDTAFTVKVLNPIDTTRLQLSTLEIVATSHPASILWIPWERNMQFHFDNILLPDSNINEPLSHGFIRYKIKPKTNLLIGDSINNMAAIYFDFNNPVLTNSAKTDIILFTGIYESGNSIDNFNLYPNPVSTLLNIEFKRNLPKNNTLELYSIFGQKLQIIEINNSQGNNFTKTIDLSHLSSGVYFLKITDGGSFVKKFVKH